MHICPLNMRTLPAALRGLQLAQNYTPPAQWWVCAGLTMYLQHWRRCTGCRSTSESATNWCASFTRPRTPMTHRSTWASWSASIRQAGHCALPVPLCAWLYLAPVWLVQTTASRCRLLFSGMRCLLTPITVRHSWLLKLILKLIYSDKILVEYHCHHCWTLRSFKLILKSFIQATF